MPKLPKSRSLTLFYILVAYVFLQLVWWGIHIIQLTSELDENDEYINRRVWMIIGEGLVFFLLLSFGVFKIKKAFKQEVKLAQQKQNFALSVSHELKSPIAAIKLFLQTLEKRNLSEDKKAELIAKSISSTNRLDGLVNNILLGTVIEQNNYEIADEKINLKTLLNDLIIVFQDTNPKANISFEYNGTEELKFDKTLVSSIISNLIDNAIKYSDAEAKVKLNVDINNSSIKFQISDEGQGISEEDKDHIFEQFYRSGNEITRKTKGTGLGLFIVHEMVSLLDGNIELNSNNPKGSVFKIILPINN